MKGLLVKDLRLLLGQKSNILFMVIICVMLMFAGNGVAFGTTYMVVLAGILGLGTVSYDAFENGMAYLLTLPIQRKTYVFEKYLFIFLSGVLAAIVMSGIGLIFVEGSMQKDNITELFVSIAAALVIVAVMISFMMPIQLKFGAEKSRIVIALIAGALFMAVTIFIKIKDSLLETLQDEELFIQITEKQLLLLGILGILIMVAVSMFISIKVLEHKEY